MCMKRRFQMRKAHVIGFLVIVLLISLTGCGAVEDSPADLTISDVKEYIGVYETAEKDAAFEIYGVSDTGEIFFSANWYNGNGFGGTAKINDNVAEFNIPVDESSAKGSIKFENNTILLNLDAGEIYALESGEYSFTFFRDFYTDTTYTGSGAEGHELFERFLTEGLVSDYVDWEYRGWATGVFAKPSQEYSDVFDLYRVETDSGNLFYCITFTNDHRAHEVYRVCENGILEMVYVLEPDLAAGIPEIPFSNNMLDTDFEIIKIRESHSLSGPQNEWREMAESSLNLCNLESVNCYMNVYANPRELIGEINNTIVFYGIGADGSMRAKEYLPDEALKTEPAMYATSNENIVAYVWKLQNGYVAIEALYHAAYEWYDHFVFSVVNVKDLDYLSYIN